MLLAALPSRTAAGQSGRAAPVRRTSPRSPDTFLLPLSNPWPPCIIDYPLVTIHYSLLSRPGVGLIINLHQMADRHARIFLRRRKAGMAEQFLNGAQVGTLR